LGAATKTEVGSNKTEKQRISDFLKINATTYLMDEDAFG
jgi:hypothetical protein